MLGLWSGLGFGLGLELVLVGPFQKHFVGIAAVGIAACTPKGSGSWAHGLVAHIFLER